MDFAHEDADYPEGAATATHGSDGNGDVEDVEEGGEDEMNQMDDEPVTQEDVWLPLGTLRYYIVCNDMAR
jgi:hypothetical protein